jgi:Histidine kinase-, DNA gyrase B-, and HSP90-like ATPase
VQIPTGFRRFLSLFQPRSAPTRQVTGQIDVGILHKADRLFRNDDKGVFIEVLQNARRAGATRVDVMLEEIPEEPVHCVVTVEDNGSGIENFQNLLTLGRSGWEQETREMEDPAGIGFFSLCQTGVEVTSLNKMVTLRPDVFLGKAVAEIVDVDHSYVTGTRLRFTRPSTKRALSEAIASVAEFCPLDIFLNGTIVARHDFLDGAIYREVIDGIEVGFATRFTHHFYTGYEDANWNFYGAVIHENFSKTSGILEPSHRGRPLVLHARFNVLETSCVKLQLPDRRSVIESDFLTAFKRKATAAAYRCFQQLPQHALSYQSWREARGLGIELPEAACLLATWSVSARDNDSDPLFGYSETKVLPSLNKVLLVTSGLPNEYTVQAALHSGAKLEFGLYDEKPEYAGYSWYDQLPRLTSSEIILDGVPYSECTAEMIQARPKRIEAKIIIEQAGHEPHTICLPALVHVDIDDEECWRDPAFVTVQGSPWEKGEPGPFALDEFLMWATFMPSDDPDADSWQTQRDYHQDLVDEIICDYFHGPHGSLLAELRKFLDSRIIHQANKLEITDLRFRRTSEGPWEIRLKRADGTDV